MTDLASRKCKIINDDIYTKDSQVLPLAIQNQFVWQFQRDNDGSAIGQGKVAIAKSIVADQVQVVNQKYGKTYGAVDNITWDDFTKCQSMTPKKDANGEKVVDASGNTVYANFDRTELANFGYKMAPASLKDTRPLKDNYYMKQAVQYVPISWDVYYPPEVVVLFVLFVGLLLLSLLIWALLSGGDDEPAYGGPPPYYAPSPYGQPSPYYQPSPYAQPSPYQPQPSPYQPQPSPYQSQFQPQPRY
jgi:hypothetical protein